MQQDAFDPGAELSAFSGGRTDIGAVVSFTGVVRDEDGTLRDMVIEHYPGMTERAIATIAEEAQTRWSLADVMVIHRHGAL